LQRWQRGWRTEGDEDLVLTYRQLWSCPWRLRRMVRDCFQSGCGVSISRSAALGPVTIMEPRGDESNEAKCAHRRHRSGQNNYDKEHLPLPLIIDLDNRGHINSGISRLPSHECSTPLTLHWIMVPPHWRYVSRRCSKGVALLPLSRGGEGEKPSRTRVHEMWSYGGKKAGPRRLWHAIEHHSGTVLAYVFGRRKDTVFLELQDLLEPFGITRFYTDRSIETFSTLRYEHSRVRQPSMPPCGMPLAIPYCRAAPP